MAVDILTEITIDRPHPEVADFVANPDNAPKWYVNIKSVEWVTSPPLNIGSKIAFVAHFLGRRVAYTYEVVEFVPGERMVMRTSDGPFPMETTYTWVPASEDATHMTLRNRGNPSGFSRLSAPLMASAMRRANRKDLSRLKQLLEQLAASSSFRSE
ncbi:MAG: SRPBCC family protein [Candidatus Marinimicrobia bacterium]|nr:SRPBCC family protein [Candidatus Neomarinimicrobiota bacterium]